MDTSVTTAHANPSDLFLPADPAARVAASPAVIALAGGFFVAVGMWCVWWLLHTPALRVDTSISGPALFAMALGLCVYVARGASRKRVTVGVQVGLVAGVVNLLLLGSKLTQTDAAGQAAPGFSGLSGESFRIIIGFMLASGVIGLAGGAIATRLPRVDAADDSSRVWLGRLGATAALAVLPLLLIGGLVTSTNAGLSVPDWPGSFGANMFLLPLAKMDDPRIYAEHSHRLFGTLVGLVTVSLFVATLIWEPRRWVKVWAGLAVIMVIAQGVVGGTWVVQQSRVLPIIHGVVGQLFFASMVALAITLSGRFVLGARGGTLTSRGVTVVVCALAALTLQLSFGAAYRHLRGASNGATHALFTHIGFSIVAMGLVLAAGIVLIRLGKSLGQDGLGSRLRSLGVGLHGLVTVQFLLGWAAWGVIATSQTAGRPLPTASELASTPQVPIWEATVRTLHQGNGAILLAAAAAAVVWALRARRQAALV